MQIYGNKDDQINEEANALLVQSFALPRVKCPREGIFHQIQQIAQWDIHTRRSML